MTHPYRFLHVLAAGSDAWRTLLETYLVAFQPGDAVALQLAVAEVDADAIAAELEALIDAWGYDPDGIPDVELLVAGPEERETLRLESDCELVPGQDRPAELRRRAGLSAPWTPPRVSIVVLAYNEADFTRQCLASVRRHTRVPYELIVIDNASTDGTAEYLVTLEDTLVLTNPENLGYAKGCNQGIAAARAQDVVLLNNDTIVTEGWLERLLAHAMLDPSVGMVGPVSNYTTAWQMLPEVPYLRYEGGTQHCDLAAMHHFARSRARLIPGQSRPVDQLAGFCMLIRRAVLDKIGGLDDRFRIGFFEDSDYAFRARIAGFELRCAEDVFVHHFGSRTFAGAKLDTERLLRENGGKFKEKWGFAPDADLTAPSAVTRLLSTPFDPDVHFSPLPEAPEVARPEPLTSIVILGFNQLSYTQLCVESVQRFTREPHELVLVDNGSTDGTTDYFRELAARHANVKVVLNTENLGFARGCNQGILASSGENILLLNNDTLVYEGWLGRLLACLDADPALGIVGPVSNYVNGPQLIQDVSYDYDLAEITRFSETWAETHAGETQELEKIVGFCMLIRRSVIEKLGGFDPRFGNGNYEDDDFCLRARVAGYRVLVARDVFIHHFGSRTFMVLGDQRDYLAAMDAGWELFKEKWRLPPEMPRRRDYDPTPLVRQEFDPVRHHVSLQAELPQPTP